LREHLGAVIATMKLSSDWHDVKIKLDKNYPRQGRSIMRAKTGGLWRGLVMKEAAN